MCGDKFNQNSSLLEQHHVLKEGEVLQAALRTKMKLGRNCCKEGKKVLTLKMWCHETDGSLEIQRASRTGVDAAHE